jgi:hypothetical protein
MTNDESPPTPRPLLTMAEAASILRIAPGTLYRWNSQGLNQELFVKLRSARSKRASVRVDPDRLRDYMLANRGASSNR